MRAKTFTYEPIPQYPHNNGQQVEREIRHERTGLWLKADNNKGGADCQGFQIKSIRSTVCNGYDLDAIFEEYAGADGFIFGIHETATYYEMSASEWREFCERFAERDKTSKGAPVMRINRQHRAQCAYCERRAGQVKA